MMADLYAKNQVDIYKRLEKNPENCFIVEIF